MILSFALFFLFPHILVATTDSPTFFPTFSPSSSPTRFPSPSPTLLPTVHVQPKPLGYYYASTYFGVTCDNVDTNQNAIIQLSGNSFGNCLVAYNESGYIVGSSSYVSDCAMSGNFYIAYYTEYFDSACQNPKSAPTTITYDSGCSTDGDETTKYYCIPASSGSSAPYASLSGGYIAGYTSTASDCKNALPHSFTWTKTGQCSTEFSSSNNIDKSSLFTCSSDSISSVESFYDSTCSKSYKYTSTRVSLCQFRYDQEGSDNYDNYVYGYCPGSHSNSNNDDVTLSSADYAGAVTGTLFAGIVIGVVVIVLSLIFCCKFTKVV
jgi:hypothetical protein